MATLEQKITSFKQEIETQEDDDDDNQNVSKGGGDSKWSKPIYNCDVRYW